MALHADRALCLRAYDYSETSQVLLLFTRQAGLLRAIAKGAKRKTKAGSAKFDGGLDLLDEGSCVYSDRAEKDLVPLTEWKLLDGHRALRSDWRGLTLGLFLAEMIAGLFEVRDPHRDLFDAFARTLRGLTTELRESAALWLALEVLRQAGLQPSLDECGDCGGRPVAFDLERGVALCENCKDSVPERVEIGPRGMALALGLQNLKRVGPLPAKLPRVGREDAGPAFHLVAEHAERQVGKRLKSRRFVEVAA